MPLYIKDDRTAELVAELARRRNLSKQDAVREAVEAKLAELGPEMSMEERLRAFRAAHPLPPPTGLKADKAFFDWLSGEE